VLGTFAQLLDTTLRGLALAAPSAAGIVALTHWAARAGHLQPFSAWARAVRRLSDPVLQPVERQIVRFGRNPQEGPLWLLGIVVISGILLLTLTRWLTRFLFTLAALGRSGPGATVLFLVDVGFSVMMFAIVVRVIGSWLGATRWTRATRWSYRLTDWLVEPIRRRLPPFGPFDLSPIVAYLALLLLRAAVFAVV
jgi:YggT family protein